MKIKNFTLTLMALTIAASQLLFTSCSSTDKVVSSNYIQKRKYMKGYYVNMDLKKDDKKNAVQALSNSQLAGNENQEETTVAADENVWSADNNINTEQEKVNGGIKPIKIIPNRIMQKAAQIYKEENAVENEYSFKKIWRDKRTGDDSAGGIGFGIVSMILGIAGIVFLFLPWIATAIIALISSLLAVVFGGIGFKRKGSGLAIAGFILGLLGLLLWLVVIILVASFL